MVEGHSTLAAARSCRRLAANQHERAREELMALLDQLSIVEVTEDLLADAAAVRRGPHIANALDHTAE